MEAAYLVVLFVGVVAVYVLKGRRKRWHSPDRQDDIHPKKMEVVLRTVRVETVSLRVDRKILHGPAYVVDGDTLAICKTKIRLFGIDAPELNHPYGIVAKRAMMALCTGQTIRAEISEFDVHGRTGARCFLADGRDLSAELVKLGLAIDWPKFSGGIYRSFETVDARKKLWLANARQQGRMDVWERYEENQKNSYIKK